VDPVHRQPCACITIRTLLSGSIRVCSNPYLPPKNCCPMRRTSLSEYAWHRPTTGCSGRRCGLPLNLKVRPTMIPTRGLRLFVVVASLVAGCSRQPSNFIAHPTPQMDAGFTVKKADVVRKADGHPRCLVGLLEGRYWVVAPTCQKEPRLRH